MPTHNQDPKKQALLWKQHIEWPKNQHKNETENFDDTTYTRSEGRKLLCKDIRTIADQFLAKNEHSPISDWENTVSDVTASFALYILCIMYTWTNIFYR